MKIFVCHTPLHCLLAAKIVERERLNAVGVIYLSRSWSAKDKRYFGRIRDHASAGAYLRLTGHAYADVPKLLNLGLRLSFLYGRGHDFYLGNPKTAYTRLLVWVLGRTAVRTFDDGIGTAAGDGYFYSDSERLSSSLFFRILDPGLLYGRLRCTIDRHYSFFEGSSPYPEAKKINVEVADGTALTVERGGKSSVLLLTAPFSEDGLLTDDEERILYQRICEEFSVTHVLAHPREVRTKLGFTSSASYQRTDLIAEEFVGELSKKGPVTIVGIGSTALATAATVPGVRAINVSVPGSGLEARAASSLYLEKMGVETCELSL